MIKYLKNPLFSDVVFATGANESFPRVGNVVFEEGDRGMFFLRDKTLHDANPPAKYEISRHSLIAENEWFECNFFDNDIPAEHFPFGYGIITPRFVQGNTTADVESLVTGKPVIIQQDFTNHKTSPQETNVHITLEHIDMPNLEPILNDTRKIVLESCILYKTVEWEFLPQHAGRYSLYFDTEFRGWGQGFAISDSATGSSMYKEDAKILAPLKQFNTGIPIEEIKCRDNLVLIQKYDGSSACVKPETKQKLIERGWALIDGKCEEDEVELMPNTCFHLTDIVFGHATKRAEYGWKLYPGGAGWVPPENSTLTRIYKDVDFGIAPLDLDAMLNDKIFVDKCESNGGIWNYTYHDCKGIWEICKDVGGIQINRDVTKPCTDGLCPDGKVYRMSCVFEYEN